MKGYRAIGVVMAIVFLTIFLTMGRDARAAGPPVDKAKIEAAKAFFKGKSIVFTVGYAPGGSYDGKARLMQPFIEKYLPGSKVLVKNVPGAGSMVATNQLYVAKPDGLTIGILSGVGVVANQVGGSKIIKYDAARFTYLGRVSAERRILLAGMKSKVQDLDSLMKSPVPVRQSLTGPGSGAYVVSQLVLTALNFPREEVTGYQGSAEAEMSQIRGETDIHMATQDSALPLIRRKELRAIFQVALNNIEGLENIPNLLTKDVERLNLSEEQLKRIRLAGDLLALGVIVAAPPRMAPERLLVLEEAVQKTLRNPDFAAICRKTGISPNIDALAGKEVLETVQRFLHMPPDLKMQIAQMMKPKE